MRRKGKMQSEWEKTLKSPAQYEAERQASLASATGSLADERALSDLLAAALVQASELLVKPSVFATWINGFVHLATALATIVSLGFYRPQWDFEYAHWRLKNQLKNHKKRIT